MAAAAALADTQKATKFFALFYEKMKSLTNGIKKMRMDGVS